MERVIGAEAAVLEEQAGASPLRAQGPGDDRVKVAGVLAAVGPAVGKPLVLAQLEYAAGDGVAEPDVRLGVAVEREPMADEGGKSLGMNQAASLTGSTSACQTAAGGCGRY